MKQVNGKSRRPKKSEQQQVERLYKSLHMDKKIYSRWMAGAETTVSTSAGGVVALATLGNAAVVNSTSDFSSIAAIYTAYRCKAIRVQLFPFMPNCWYNGTTAYTMPAILAVFPWTSNTVPTTFAQACDVTGVKFVSGYEKAIVSTTYRGDPDAHLWTGTGSAIGSSEQFGISIIGTAATATASNAVFRVLVDYLVEFRMAG